MRPAKPSASALGLRRAAAGAALAGLALAGCAAVPRRGAGPLAGSGSRTGQEGAPAATSTGSAGAEPSGIPLHGSLRTRYRLRATPDQDDNDLDALLQLDAGDAELHPLTGHLQLWANLDLDDRGAADPFFDLSDTHDRDLTARLQQAFVDVHDVEDLDVLRVGRQPLYETPEILTFDGVRAETTERGSAAWRAGAYGGVPAHLYESSPHGDAVLGAFAEARAWRGGWTRLDWMHLEDDDLLGEHRNDLLGLSAWQTLGPRLRLEGAYSHLEGEGRDLRATASWLDAERDCSLRLSYYELLNAQKDLATEVDPFFEALLEHFPFRQAQVLFSKGFRERYHLEAGSELRRLRDGDDEGRYNHDFERHHARVGVEDVLDSGLSLGVSGEVLAGRDGGDVRTWSGDLSREWGAWRASGGTYYALYDLDPLTADERDHVRVWFLDLRWELTSRMRLDLAYEFENDDLDEYHLLRLGALWRF